VLLLWLEQSQECQIMTWRLNKIIYIYAHVSVHTNERIRTVFWGVSQLQSHERLHKSERNILITSQRDNRIIIIIIIIAYSTGTGRATFSLPQCTRMLRFQP